MFGINYLLRSICRPTPRHKHVLSKSTSCTCTSAVKMLGVGMCERKYVIQGVSRLEDITAGGDFLGLCD